MSHDIRVDVRDRHRYGVYEEGLVVREHLDNGARGRVSAQIALGSEDSDLVLAIGSIADEGEEITDLGQ
jgi:hypothetical protein